MEVLQCAMKNYFDKKQEHEEKIYQKQKKEEQAELASKPYAKRLFMNIFKLEFGLQLLIIILMFALFWYVTKGGLVSHNTFWK